jgi:hypothetical protein
VVKSTCGAGEKGVRAIEKEGSQTVGGGITATRTTVSIATDIEGVEND